MFHHHAGGIAKSVFGSTRGKDFLKKEKKGENCNSCSRQITRVLGTEVPNHEQMDFWGLSKKLGKLASGRDAHVEKDLFLSVRGLDEKLHLMLRPPAGSGAGGEWSSATARHALSREVDESDALFCRALSRASDGAELAFSSTRGVFYYRGDQSPASPSHSRSPTHNINREQRSNSDVSPSA